MVAQEADNNIADPDDDQYVMVIYGRNQEARTSLFAFLRALSLKPIEWDSLVDLTNKGAPYIGEALEVGFKKAKASVVLFTPDDIAYLREELWREDDGQEERQPKGQPRQNVLFEAGMAFGLHPDRTILVQLGDIRTMSDIYGRHIIRLSNDVRARKALAQRLSNAGCDVQIGGTDWFSAGDFNIEYAQTPSSITGNGNVRVAYMTALDFVKTVHHHFQELQQHGFQAIEYASRTLYKNQSQGNDPKLVKECEAGWADTEESRNAIQKEILNRYRKLLRTVQDAYDLLWTTEQYAAPTIATSFGCFKTIEESIKKYKNTLPSLASRFHAPSGTLATDEMIPFNQDVIEVSIVVERLIRESDAAIKNLINAFQCDSRVSPEQ